MPLAVLLVLRRYAGELSRRAFVIALGALLALQLWTSSEVFATMILSGGLAFLIGAALAGPERRPRIWAVALEALGALALAVVLAAPYLYYALRYPNPVSGIEGVNAGADLVNFVLPTMVTWLHATGGLARDANRLQGNLTERLGYLGVPLLVLLGVVRARVPPLAAGTLPADLRRGRGGREPRRRALLRRARDRRAAAVGAGRLAAAAALRGAGALRDVHVVGAGGRGLVLAGAARSTRARAGSGSRSWL